MIKNVFNQDKTRREAGQVSIVTVVIFILLFSIVVVSFTRIMVASSHETTSDELRASALAAAESGVEDAKRILSYCSANPTASGCDSNGIESANQNCNTLLGNSNLMTAVGLSSKTTTINGTGTSQVQVGNGQQYYQCLMINMQTTDYVGNLTAGGPSAIIPLNSFKGSTGNDNITTVKIEWHNASLGDGTANLVGGTDFPSMSQWVGGNNNKPAVLRVELVWIKDNSFDLNTVITSTSVNNGVRAFTVRPSSSGSVGSVTLQNNSTNYVASTTPNTMTPVPLITTLCTPSNDYACSFTIADNNNLTTSARIFYLRIQALYNSTNYRVTAYNNQGKMYVDGLQPSVDVTGRAVDSFQRIRARVQPANTTGNPLDWYPEYAIDSGGRVCKQLSVGTTGTDSCVYN